MRLIKIVTDTYIAGKSYQVGAVVEVDDSVAKELLLNRRAVYVEMPEELNIKEQEMEVKAEAKTKKGGKR